MDGDFNNLSKQISERKNIELDDRSVNFEKSIKSLVNIDIEINMIMLLIIINPKLTLNMKTKKELSAFSMKLQILCLMFKVRLFLS